MSLLDVQHQPVAQAVVQQSLHSGRLAHGLLLVGPGGVGKEMFATRLSALLLCDNPVQATDGAERVGLPGADLPAGLAPPPGAPWRDACGACESCRLISAGTHPDLHLVYRQLHKFASDSKVRNQKGLDLYIDVIREFLIEPAAQKAVRGRGKMFLVRDAHLMNDDAQNALLKTLEEPPPGTFLMLLTDQAHGLLPTVRSRCQLIRFRPLPREFVHSFLLGRKTASGRVIAPDEAAYLAGRSGGQLGAALEMAEGDLFGLHQELAQRLSELTPSRAIDLADWLEEQVNQLAGEQVKRDEVTDSQAKKDVACQLLSTASLAISDAMRLAAGVAPGGNVLFPRASEALARTAAGGDRADGLIRLAGAVRALNRAAWLIADRYVNPHLALDEAAVAVADALGG